MAHQRVMPERVEVAGALGLAGAGEVFVDAFELWDQRFEQRGAVAYGHDLELRQQRIGLAHLARRQFADRETAAQIGADEALALKMEEGFAQRRAADLQFARQAQLVELIAAFEFALNDAVEEL